MRRAAASWPTRSPRCSTRCAPGATTADLDRVAEAYIREQATPSFLGYRGHLSGHDLRLDRRRDRARHPLAAPSARGGDSYSSTSTSGRGSTPIPGGHRRRRGRHADRGRRTAGEDDRGGPVRGHRRGATRGRISDIGHAIASVAEAAGLGIVREYGGHGIGRSLHEDPFIQNFGRAGQGPDLRPGLVITDRADADARRGAGPRCSPTSGRSSRPTARCRRTSSTPWRSPRTGTRCSRRADEPVRGSFAPAGPYTDRSPPPGGCSCTSRGPGRAPVREEQLERRRKTRSRSRDGRRVVAQRHVPGGARERTQGVGPHSPGRCACTTSASCRAIGFSWSCRRTTSPEAVWCTAISRREGPQGEDPRCRS